MSSLFFLARHPFTLRLLKNYDAGGDDYRNNIDDGEEFACEELKTVHTCLTESCARKTQYMKNEKKRNEETTFDR